MYERRRLVIFTSRPYHYNDTLSSLSTTAPRRRMRYIQKLFTRLGIVCNASGTRHLEPFSAPELYQWTTDGESHCRVYTHHHGASPLRRCRSRTTFNTLACLDLIIIANLMWTLRYILATTGLVSDQGVLGHTSFPRENCFTTPVSLLSLHLATHIPTVHTPNRVGETRLKSVGVG